MPDAQLPSDKQLDNTKEKPWLWKPGQSGNPNGRPPKGYAISDLMREAIDGDQDLRKQLIERLINLALGGDLNAIRELLDRVEGKAIQKIEVKSPTAVEDELDKLDTDYEQLASKAKRQMVALEPLIQNQEQAGPASDVPTQPAAIETHGGEGEAPLQPDSES